MPSSSSSSARRKKGRGGGANGGYSSAGVLPPEFFEEVHLSSGGDLRNAIFAMQFQCGINIGGKALLPSSSSSNTKDAKLSTFHALGKLLYAKRKETQQQHMQFDQSDSLLMSPPSPVSKSTAATTTSGNLPPTAKWDDGRGPLNFVPEHILQRIDMGLPAATSFLSYHCPDFHTDITDLSRSLSSFSDASFHMDYRYTSSSNDNDGPFPMEYAACIAGRAVANGNVHPAPSKFRQFVTPQVFAVLRKRRENEMKIERLRKRLAFRCNSRGDGKDGADDGQEQRNGICIHDTIGSSHGFVTDSLPFMRRVIPEDINYALANLHSYAKETDGQEAAALLKEHHDMERENNNVLLEDDLVDDDDDDW